MPFDWKEYLELAKEQRKSIPAGNVTIDDKIQAKLRCAISRAYYAVFILAREYLCDIENDPNLTLVARQKAGESVNQRELREAENALRSVHTYVQKCFKASQGLSKTDSIRQEVSKALRELSDERQEADYESDYQPKVATLDKQIHDAEKALKQIEQLQSPK